MGRASRAARRVAGGAGAAAVPPAQRAPLRAKPGRPARAPGNFSAERRGCRVPGAPELGRGAAGLRPPPGPPGPGNPGSARLGAYEPSGRGGSGSVRARGAMFQGRRFRSPRGRRDGARGRHCGAAGPGRAQGIPLLCNLPPAWASRGLQGVSGPEHLGDPPGLPRTWLPPPREGSARRPAAWGQGGCGPGMRGPAQARA